ncbi:MAG: ribonuclease III [Gammaproteobacteria bacterium]|nr:ribonuclease III [Gammaproteobacteria bacterium]
MLKKAETWLKNSLDYEFNDVRLLEQSLTHRSAPGDNNERLEFLGDAVLDFVISEVVFRAHPLAAEGDLSRLRASLVKDTSLAELAAELGLGEQLILGSGERKTGGHRRESILADALEAIFGAIYIDAGFDAARRAIERAFGARLEEFPSVAELRDPKTRLQEWLQARQLGLPTYELIRVSGQAHRQTFEVSCSVAGRQELTSGSGSTLRNAEQEAAERMFLELNQDAAG